MYPDTDLPLTKIPRDTVNKIKASLNLRPWESIEKFKKMGIPEHFHERLLTFNRKNLIEELIKSGIKPVLAVTTITETLKTVKRNGFKTSDIPDRKFFDLFNLYNKKKFSREHFYSLFTSLSKGDSPENAVAKLGLNLDEKFKSRVMEITSEIINKLLPLLENKFSKDKYSSSEILHKETRAVTGEVLRIIDYRYPAKEIAVLATDALRTERGKKNA